jgi:hypothetical protein
VVCVLAGVVCRAACCQAIVAPSGPKCLCTQLMPCPLPPFPACAGPTPSSNDPFSDVNTIQLEELDPEIIAAARARRSQER